jgi:hypothetical protein
MRQDQSKSEPVTVEMFDATFRGLHQQIIGLQLVTGRLIAELVKGSDDPQATWDRIDRALAQTSAGLCTPDLPNAGMMTFALAIVRENAAGFLANDGSNVDPTHSAPHPAHWTTPFTMATKRNVTQ